jgi:succinate-semialdehyde dehydrogenase/glutarate-semialdehyde dehydrogenase
MFCLQMLINGEYVSSLSGKSDVIYNPANREAVAQVSVGSRQEARQALEAAKNAFPHWAATSAGDRGEILRQAALEVRKRAKEISRLLTLEMGKPLKNARMEVIASAQVLEYYAEEGRRNLGHWIAHPNARSLVIQQPIGVAALITPWNFPVNLLAWKVGAALAAGCTFVAKPPSLAPLAATEFVKAIAEAGLPAGVANVVHGPGREVGAELVENPISRKIAFTGETETGRWIMEHAAGSIKRVSLELGGQTPLIVCEDADLDRAVAACVQRAFSNMGQICFSINRIYAAEKIAEEFTSQLVERTQKLKIGDGMNPEVDLGPMFSEAQRQKTKDHIADALAKGAELLCGGRTPSGDAYARGYFFLPTVLDGANHTMRVMREETFGPVAPIMRFKTLQEGIDLANDSEYGLAAFAFTESLRTALHLAERLEAGGIGINTGTVMELQAPFGGWKQSGLGRELGAYGLEEYLELKHIRIGM